MVDLEEMKKVTGLPLLRQHRTNVVGPYYIDGTPHSRTDKLAFFEGNDGGIVVQEQGGISMSLYKWSKTYGDGGAEASGTGMESRPVQPERKKMYVDRSVVIRMMDWAKTSYLYKYLLDKMGPEISDSFRKYGVGMDYGRTVFWHMNVKKEICCDNQIYYQQDGNRNKKFTPFKNYLVKNGYSGKGVFGGHLINPNERQVINVVESEKTALMMDASGFLQYGSTVWIAVGGSNKLGSLLTLEGLTDKERKCLDIVLFPDYDKAGATWECFGCKSKTTCESRKNKDSFGCEYRDSDFTMMEWWGMKEFSGMEIEAGDDIGDVLLKRFY